MGKIACSPVHGNLGFRVSVSSTIFDSKHDVYVLLTIIKAKSRTQATDALCKIANHYKYINNVILKETSMVTFVRFIIWKI